MKRFVLLLFILINSFAFSQTSIKNGVVIDSKAEKMGFREGDIIIQIEQTRITSLKDLNQALKDYKNTKKRVIINRQNYRAILVMP
jgi:serine protease Do